MTASRTRLRIRSTPPRRYRHAVAAYQAGSRVWQLSRARDVTPNELAERIGVGADHIRAMIAGRLRGWKRIVPDLAAALNVEEALILRGEGEWPTLDCGCPAWANKNPYYPAPTHAVVVIEAAEGRTFVGSHWCEARAAKFNARMDAILVQATRGGGEPVTHREQATPQTGEPT